MQNHLKLAKNVPKSTNKTTYDLVSSNIICVHCWGLSIVTKVSRDANRTGIFGRCVVVGRGVEELKMGGPGRGKTNYFLQTTLWDIVEVEKLRFGG